jgi:hypothetical protein
MFVLDARSEWIAAVALAVLMAATRIHHFGVGSIAPDASTAVFFLAGLMLMSPWWFAAFVAEAMALDALAIGAVGIEAVCVTWGYGLLFAGYFALWLAGRQLRPAARLDLFTAGKLVCLAAGGVAAFFAISNLGYYFGGGYDDAMGAAEYVARVGRYFSFYLTVTLGYGAAGIALLMLARRGRAVLAAR